MYQFFVNIALVECEVHWGRVGLALKCTLSVLESALESFQIEKDAIGPFTALRSFLENNQLPLCKLNTFQNRAISPTTYYEDPIEGNGSNWPPAPWIGGLLTELKGAGSFHIHRKTMKDLGILAVLGVREQPNLAYNLVTRRHW